MIVQGFNPPAPQFVYFVVSEEGYIISPPQDSREGARQWMSKHLTLKTHMIRRAKLTLYTS